MYKDLTIFKKDLKDVIIVDNSPEYYSLQKENGIPIETWQGNQNDTELSKLGTILTNLFNVDDVRKFIPKIVKENKLVQELCKEVFKGFNPIPMADPYSTPKKCFGLNNLVDRRISNYENHDLSVSKYLEKRQRRMNALEESPIGRTNLDYSYLNHRKNKSIHDIPTNYNYTENFLSYDRNAFLERINRINLMKEGLYNSNPRTYLNYDIKQNDYEKGFDQASKSYYNLNSINY